MTHSISFTSNEKERKAAGKAVYKLQSRQSKILTELKILACLSVIFLLIYFLFYHFGLLKNLLGDVEYILYTHGEMCVPDEENDLLYSLYIMSACAVSLFIGWQIFVHTRSKRLIRLMMPITDRRFVYELTPEHFVSHTYCEGQLNRTILTPWLSIRRIAQTETFLLFFNEDLVASYLPVRVFASTDAADNFYRQALVYHAGNGEKSS